MATMSNILGAVANGLVSWICSITVNHILGAIVVYWFYGIPVLADAALFHNNNNRARPALAWGLQRHQRGRRRDGHRSSSSSPVDSAVDLLDEKLKLEIPESTESERQRFLRATNGDFTLAISRLRNYLEWRSSFADIEIDDEDGACESLLADPDKKAWKMAAARALLKAGRSIAAGVDLPRVARTYSSVNNNNNKDSPSSHNHCVDRQGYRIIQLSPGQIDERLAPVDIYATAIALYIDSQLQRNSHEKVTVVIDVRGGQGWRNLHVGKLLPFLKNAFKLLLNLFPERLARAIVFPVPVALLWIWKIVRGYLEADTADKICLLTGPARIASPPPSKAMAKYLEDHVMTHLEKERLAAFVEEPSQ